MGATRLARAEIMLLGIHLSTLLLTWLKFGYLRDDFSPHDSDWFYLIVVWHVEDDLVEPHLSHLFAQVDDFFW